MNHTPILLPSFSRYPTLLKRFRLFSMGEKKLGMIVISSKLHKIPATSDAKTHDTIRIAFALSDKPIVMILEKKIVEALCAQVTKTPFRLERDTKEFAFFILQLYTKDFLIRYFGLNNLQISVGFAWEQPLEQQALASKVSLFLPHLRVSFLLWTSDKAFLWAQMKYFQFKKPKFSSKKTAEQVSPSLQIPIPLEVGVTYLEQHQLALLQPGDVLRLDKALIPALTTGKISQAVLALSTAVGGGEASVNFRVKFQQVETTLGVSTTQCLVQDPIYDW